MDSAAPGIVALWSMPRSRSTAFFRMMAQRGDFRTLHEPFSSLDFGRPDIGGHPARSHRAVLDAIRALAREGPVFFKDTTDKPYPDVLADERFLARDAVHTFLIRDPAETIPSYHALRPEFRRDEVGAQRLHELYHRVAELTQANPVVLDAADLIGDPAGVVRAYCERVGIPYAAHALTWPPGDRDEWRSTARWHADASASTGFAPTSSRYDVEVADHPVLAEYLAHHRPFYDDLHARRLTVHDTDP